MLCYTTLTSISRWKTSTRLSDWEWLVRLAVGQCHPGEKDMTLKEERKYNLIEEKLVYKPDQRKWEAGYPFYRETP